MWLWPSARLLTEQRPTTASKYTCHRVHGDPYYWSNMLKRSLRHLNTSEYRKRSEILSNIIIIIISVVQMWKSFKDFHNCTNPKRVLHCYCKSEVQCKKTLVTEISFHRDKKNNHKQRVRTKRYQSTINKTNQQNKKSTRLKWQYQNRNNGKHF